MSNIRRPDAMRRGTAAQIVLLPGGQVGQEVLRRVEVWSAEGLLDPVYWVPVDLVHEHIRMPAQITAIVFGRNTNGAQEHREVPLLAALGQESIDQLVVTSVRWLSPTQQDRDSVSLAAKHLLSAVRDGMPLPRRIDEKSLGGTTIRALNLVFASTKVCSEELAELISNDWDENILVSPEDRQRPNAADRFTDAEDIQTWAGFVAASVSTLAGLWTGYASTPITRVPGSGAATDVPQVRVARTFARAVISGDFAVELARSVASELVNPKTPLLNPVVASQVTSLAALSSEDVRRYLDEAMSKLSQTDSQALSYKPLPNQVGHHIPSRGSLRSFQRFSSFSGNKLSAVPGWVWDRVTGLTAKGGKGSPRTEISENTVDRQVGPHTSQADRDLMEVDTSIRSLQSAVLRDLNQPPLPVTRVKATTLWNAIREHVFALLDGRSDHQDIETPTKGKKVAVVPDVGMVIPAPWDIWELPSNAARHLTGEEDVITEVEWTDIRGGRELLDHLTERTADLEMRYEEAKGKSLDSRHSLIASEREYVEARESYEDLMTELDESLENLQLLESGIGGEFNA